MSVALVVAQFVLIALLASPLATLVPRTGPGAVGALLIAASLVLVATAFLAMRPANFSVLPEPVAGNRLVERGPYAHVRHPMYSAVLLGGLGTLLLHGGAFHLALYGVLTGVMLVKSRREERLLAQVHPEYPAYAARTAALVPKVY